MNLWALIARAGRLQRERVFKIAASIVAALLIVGGYATYAVLVLSGRVGPTRSVAERFSEEFLKSPTGQTISGVLTGDNGLIAVGVGAGLTLALWMAIIWLNAALGYLAVTVAGLLAAGLYELAAPESVVPALIIGLVFLAQGFLIGIQAVRALFSPHTPVFAIARNVLTEAIRMKISLVFIVALVVGLAFLPALLDPEEPLRYRVQTFISWGGGASFWVLAILTLLFGVATVTFEQRDKTIWQTAVKPVAAWQYVLGKWLGLVGLNAVLLAVCMGGVFLFTEHLRTTPAMGEREAYVAAGDQAISQDRLLLETQVLAARKARPFQYPFQFNRDSEAFQQALEERIDREKRTNPGAGLTAEDRHRIADELFENLTNAYRSIPPGGAREFSIPGLQEAKQQGRPISLRYRIDAGANRPDQFYTLSFLFPREQTVAPEVRETGLGYFHTIELSPQFINERGELRVRVYNGEILVSNSGQLRVAPNPDAISFPERGLQVTYEAGSYHLNFARAAGVLWVKLAFLAMIAVWAGTFLSFPVAAMVAFATFILAEMSGWLANAGDTYGYKDAEGNLAWWKVLTTPIAEAAGWVFGIYSDLQPVDTVVQGLYFSWANVAAGVGVLLLITAVFYGLAVLFFARRELATYPGD